MVIHPQLWEYIFVRHAGQKAPDCFHPKTKPMTHPGLGSAPRWVHESGQTQPHGPSVQNQNRLQVHQEANDKAVGTSVLKTENRDLGNVALWPLTLQHRTFASLSVSPVGGSLLETVPAPWCRPAFGPRPCVCHAASANVLNTSPPGLPKWNLLSAPEPSGAVAACRPLSTLCPFSQVFRFCTEHAETPLSHPCSSITSLFAECH